MGNGVNPLLVIFAVIVIVLLLLYFLVKYNKLIGLRNKVKQAKSGIDVYLNQRFDLIPNLVECVKAYSKHENELLSKITEMRLQYLQGNNNLKNAEIINNNLNKLLAIAENYPDLKASKHFFNLQNNLTKMESQLQAARRIYNNEVTAYNTVINVVPSNFIAKLFGFKEAELFEIEEYKKENINVNL